MPNSRSFALFAISAAATILMAVAVTVVAGVDSSLVVTMMAPHCKGSIAECLEGEGEEFQLDSEINRRVLADSGGYISYGAMRRNTVPCSRRGASYYNCQQGAQANPYSRGCSAIARCRGG